MAETKKRHLCLPPWPDVRGWALVVASALSFYILAMIRGNPALLANASFMQFVGTMESGTLILLFMNLFGGTKSGTEAQSKTTEALIAGGGTGTGGSTTISAPSSGSQTIVTAPQAQEPPPDAAAVAAADAELKIPPTPQEPRP